MSDDLPPLIPLEVLFGNPTYAQPSVSPDGSRLAYLAPDEEVLNVWVRTIGATDDRPVTKDRDRGVRQYGWAEDARHILYIQDRGGDENWRLYATDLESGETRDLTPFEGVQVNWIHTDKRAPHEVLFAMNRDDPRLHDVYHLDLRTGDMELAAKNPGTVAAWVADADMRVRAAVAATPEGGYDLMHRVGDDGEWDTIVQWGPEDAFASGPEGFTLDGRRMYLQDSRDANTGRLVRLDLESGDVEVLAEDPRYDVSGVELHPDTYEVQLVGFTRARSEWEVLDPSIQADVDRIAALGEGDWRIVSRDHADGTWIIQLMPDDGPVSYYAYDRTTGEATFLFHHRPDLNTHPLTRLEPVSYTARDGLEIEGYLSLPQGAEPKNLPTVLVVHGGPWAREVWGYDPHAQWLSNRGYAVLMPNFRGSVGYGKDFVNAGDREWGGKMHDDLVDGVRWLIDRGIADPSRVAIFGGSYGGYAALCGATFTPELFRCAVDIVGPSNLITWITSIPPYWQSMVEMLYGRVGHPEKDEEFLKSRSPLFAVDRIRIPLLIAQGANDPRVPQPESEQIVGALVEKGIDHDYMLFADEGHGFAKPDNRLRFYAAADRFLAKHLGGRAEA